MWDASVGRRQAGANTKTLKGLRKKRVNRQLYFEAARRLSSETPGNLRDDVQCVHFKRRRVQNLSEDKN